jgi:hypothetical protein
MKIRKEYIKKAALLGDCFYEVSGIGFQVSGIRYQVSGISISFNRNSDLPNNFNIPGSC